MSLCRYRDSLFIDVEYDINFMSQSTGEGDVSLKKLRKCILKCAETDYVDMSCEEKEVEFDRVLQKLVKRQKVFVEGERVSLVVKTADEVSEI